MGEPGYSPKYHTSSLCGEHPGKALFVFGICKRQGLEWLDRYAAVNGGPSAGAIFCNSVLRWHEACHVERHLGTPGHQAAELYFFCGKLSVSERIRCSERPL